MGNSHERVIGKPLVGHWAFVGSGLFVGHGYIYGSLAAIIILWGPWWVTNWQFVGSRCAFSGPLMSHKRADNLVGNTLYAREGKPCVARRVSEDGW